MKPDLQEYREEGIPDEVYQEDLALWEANQGLKEWEDAMVVAAHLSEESQVYNLVIEI